MKKEYLISIFLLLGPILDVTNFLGLPISVLVRGIFLVGITFDMFKNKKNRKPLMLLSVFGLISFFYQISYLRVGMILAISAVLKFLYLPINLLFFKDYSFSIPKEKILGIILISYMGIYLLSYLLNIGNNIYSKAIGKNGFEGLFSSINEFCAILIGLLPVVTNALLEKKKWILLGIVIILSVCCSLLAGTKVLMGGVFLCLVFLLWQARDEIFIKRSKKTKTVIVIATLFILFSGGFLFTKTSTYQNMIVQQKFFKVRNIISFDFLNKVVYNDRLSFLEVNTKYFFKQGMMEKLFGISLAEDAIKLVEIDIFDILFRFGVIGCILFLVFTLKSIKWKNITLPDKISILLLFVISLTSGHVLIYPAVCIYLPILASRRQEAEVADYKRSRLI